MRLINSVGERGRPLSWLEVKRKLGQQEIAYWLEEVEVRYFVLEKLICTDHLEESRNITELSCI